MDKLVFLLFGLQILNGVYSATNCNIPNQTPSEGRCVNLEECTPYKQLLKQSPITVEQINFIRKVQCDAPGFICCPLGSAGYQNTTCDVDKTKTINRTPIEDIQNRFGTDDDEDCGIVFGQRIIGGNFVELDEYPWAALLIYNTTTSNMYGCSGTLIKKNYVLTAAHCVSEATIKEKGGNLIAVRLGEYNIRSDPDCIEELNGYDCAEKAVNAEVEKVIIHPYYDDNSRSKHHDIALIKLKNPVNYTHFVYSICLPSKELNAGVTPGNKMKLVGWGQTDFFSSRLGNAPSDIKLYVEVPVVNQTTCENVFRNLNLELGMGQMCAGGEKNRDACPGDSGGGLMYLNGAANKYVCSGIVSLGKGSKGKIACGDEGFPGIYTRTEQYINWIENAINHN